MSGKFTRRCIDKLDQVGFGWHRISKRGVPHLVVEKYSVTYFLRLGFYRVFHPWPGFFNQEKWDFKTAAEVQTFLASRLSAQFKEEPNVGDNRHDKRHENKDGRDYRGLFIE